jgi:hypothetical protein
MVKTNPATLTQVLDFIREASAEDMKSIVNAFNEARNHRIAEAKDEFKVGDKVMFHVNKRGWPRTIRGVIIRKNVKTFQVRPNDGGREWKVTASLVKKDDQAT